MIKDTIKSVIREFDHCRYAVHSLHDLHDEPYLQQWVHELATVIAAAVQDQAMEMVNRSVPEFFTGGISR